MTGVILHATRSREALYRRSAALGVVLLMVVSASVAVTSALVAADAVAAAHPASTTSVTESFPTVSVGGAAPAAAAPAAPVEPRSTSVAPERVPFAPGDAATAGVAAMPTPSAASPVLVTIPTSGSVGSPVTINASGYTHLATFTVKYENGAGTNVTACSGTTDKKGYFQCTISLPPLPAGPRTFSGSDAKATETATFTVVPQLTISPSTGLVGTMIALHATGFGSKVVKKARTFAFPYSLTWSQGTVCSGNDQLSGDFNCSLTIPAVPGGAQTFTATDNASDTASATFTVLAGLTVGPNYGPDGTNLSYAGNGYAASSPVTVTWSPGSAVGCKANSAGTGVFSCTGKVPASTPGGTYTLTATDGRNSAESTFVVTYLTLSPEFGPVGTHISITTGGLRPSHPFNVTYDGATICSGESTNSFGVGTCKFNITKATAGIHDFKSFDGAGDYANATFDVEPQLTTSPSYGPTKTAVEFAGTGFAGGSPISVTWANGTACSSKTSAGGAFDCNFTIPAGTAGDPYVFNATDLAGNSATATFVVTYLFTTPAAGPTGSGLALSGGGFAPSSPYTISFGATVLCSGADTNTTGTLSCTSAKVPVSAYGSHTLVAVDGSHNTASTTFSVTPQLSFPKAPATVAVGGRISFNETGFAAGSKITVTWAGGTACANTTTAVGSWQCNDYSIPAMPAGLYVFTATDGAGHSATGSLKIGPTLVASTYSTTVGGKVTFTATGFAASSAITVSWSSGTACSGTTNGSGNFSCRFTIPATPDGSYTFTAADGASNKASTPSAIRISPKVTESPTSGPPGTTVTFSGTGFPATALIDVTWSGGTACSHTSLSTGSFTCSFSVPASPAGAYVFTATNTTSGVKATVSYTVSATLALSPDRGPVGTTIDFTGTGFGASVGVVVSWGGGTACGSASTGASGTFTCAYKLPAARAGVHTFTANDTTGKDTARATFTVVPALSTDPTAGPVGTQITFNGTGFGKSVPVTVAWSSGTVCPSTTTAAGSFSCTVNLPAATFGVHEFTAQDNESHAATANFSVVPQLTATPSSGLIGTKVVFAGTGYGASVRVNVTWAKGTACSNTSTASGAFRCSFVIPVGTYGGLYPFTGADGAGDSAIATFTVITSLKATPDRGVGGTSVEFSGSGYEYPSTVTVTWPNGTAACAAPTTTHGTFACNATIAVGTAGGVYTFTAHDTDSDTATVQFTVTFLSDSPGGGLAGTTTVVFTAGGFASNSTFGISWTGGTACSGTTSTTGTFRCSYTIPAATMPGKYTFTAEDGASTKATVVFDVFGVPSTSSPSPSKAAADVGQEINFTTTATGGSGVYTTYTWSESSTSLGCELENAATISCIPTAKGNYTVSVVVTDSNGISSSSERSATLPVSSDPVVGTPTLNVTAPDANQSVEFSVTASGGSGSLHYSWSGLPAGCSGATAKIACTPTNPVSGGSVTVTVTDANGFSVTSAPFALTIFADPTVATPSANRTSVDVGQSVTFATVGAHGSGDLKYTWTGLPTGCAGTTAVIVCTPTAATSPTTTISVSVRDSNGFRAAGPSTLLYKVYAAPTIGAPTATHASVDLSQSVTFSVTGSGGSGGLVFSWSGLPTGCSGSGTSVACTPKGTGAFTVVASVTDSNGDRVSASLSFVVYSDPTIGPTMESRSSADLGQMVDFSANVTGGSGAYTFSWGGFPAGCAVANSVTVVCSTVVTPGEYNITVTITDANGFGGAAPTLEFHFFVDPTVATPSANRTSADVGQPIVFSTTVGGGAGDLTVAWLNLPVGCAGTGTVVDCTPTGPSAELNVTAVVTDANGDSVTSTVLVYVVDADPAISPVAATPTAVDVGQGLTLTVTVTLGSGGTVYTWKGLPTGCSGTTATIVCASVGGSAGTFAVSVTAADSNGYAVTSAVLDLVVSPALVVPVPKATEPGADVGESVTISVAASGGSGTYGYAWSGLPSGCTGTTTASVVCVPTAALASTSITVTVTDANGNSVTSPALAFSVTAALTAKLASNSGSILEGQKVTFSVTVAGGAGTDSYAWTGLPAGCSSSDSATITCTPTATGSFTVAVVVTDGNGATATSSTSVSVNASFLGLPQLEGIAIVVVAALAAIVVVTVLLVRRRRQRPAAPLPWAPTAPGPTAPGEPTAVAPPPTWSPPPATPATPEEPESWEMPTPESDPGSSPEAYTPGPEETQ